MKKLIFAIMFLMVLIPLSSGTTVELNAPIDDYISPTFNVLFNATGNATTLETVRNITLWTNSTGSWEANEVVTYPTSYSEIGTIAGMEHIYPDCADDSENTVVDDFVSEVNMTCGLSNPTRQWICGVIFYYEDGTTYSAPTQTSNTFSSAISFENIYSTRKVDNVTATLSHNSCVNPSSFFAEDIKIYSTDGWGNFTQTFERTLTESTLWNVEMCEAVGICAFSPSNRTLTIDQSSPIISVESPTGTIVFGSDGGQETLNVTFTDVNIDTCWFDYNGTNTTIEGCLSGVSNATDFTLQTGVYNMTIYVNDTVGNDNSQFISWTYTAFEESVTGPSTILVGDPGAFSTFFTLSSGTTINTANLMYDSTAYSVSIDSLGSNQYNITRVLSIPDGSGATPYYFNLSLSTGDLINTTSNNVTVSSLALDDCSSYTNVLYNFTMYDEQDLSILNSSGDSTNASLNIQMYSVSTGEEISNFSKTYTTTNPFKICMQNPLTPSSDNRINLQVQYKATGYAEEFYHIVGDVLTDTDMNTQIPLYSLINTSSQIFTIKYLDSSFSPVTNAVIQIQRLYVGEGISRTVEQPLTDSSGETLAHLQLNNVVYTFTILVNNSVDAVFNNVFAVCQNPTFEDCKIELLAVDSFIDVFDFSTVGLLDFTGPSYDRDTRIVSTLYSVRDGTTKLISLNVTLFDALGTTEVCSITDTASAGTISCVVPVSFGNTTVIATLYADGVKTAEAILNLAQNPSDIYGSNLVWVGMVIFISFLGIGLSGNPVVTGLFLIISTIVLVYMNVIYSSGWIGGGATILFFIIAVLLIIIKGSKRG